jgi:hypothetical protein
MLRHNADLKVVTLLLVASNILCYYEVPTLSASCATDECFTYSCFKATDQCFEYELTTTEKGRSENGVVQNGTVAGDGNTRQRTKSSCTKECSSYNGDQRAGSCGGTNGSWNDTSKSKCNTGS